jgi:hypothetical protein
MSDLALNFPNRLNNLKNNHSNQTNNQQTPCL